MRDRGVGDGQGMGGGPKREIEGERKRESRCFEPRQPQGIISGLREREREREREGEMVF